LFTKITEFAEIPFKVKSVASTVAGFTASLTSKKKTVVGCGASMILSQGGLFTEQGAAVSEATPSRNVMMAMNNVVARVITPSIISSSLARKAKQADSDA
jgi:hypothetical protein